MFGFNSDAKPGDSKPAQSLFGGSSSQAPATGGGLFGAKPAGSAGGGMFGAGPAGASASGGFGAKPAGASLFGAGPAGSGGAASQGAGGSLFGGAGQNKPAGGSMFGAGGAVGSQPASGFGSNQSKPAGSSLFGGPPKPAAEGSAFGSNAGKQGGGSSLLFGGAQPKKEGNSSLFTTGTSAPAPAPGGFSSSGGGGMFSSNKQTAPPSSQGFSAPGGGIKSSQPLFANNIATSQKIGGGSLASSGSNSGMGLQINSNPNQISSQPNHQNSLKSYKEVKAAQNSPQKLDKDSEQLKQKLSEHEPIQTHSHYAKSDLGLIQDLFRVYSSYCTKYSQFVGNMGGQSGPQMTYQEIQQRYSKIIQEQARDYKQIILHSANGNLTKEVAQQMMHFMVFDTTFLTKSRYSLLQKLLEIDQVTKDIAQGGDYDDFNQKLDRNADIATLCTGVISAIKRSSFLTAYNGFIGNSNYNRQDLIAQKIAQRLLNLSNICSSNADHGGINLNHDSIFLQEMGERQKEMNDILRMISNQEQQVSQFVKNCKHLIQFLAGESSVIQQESASERSFIGKCVTRILFDSHNPLLNNESQYSSFILAQFQESKTYVQQNQRLLADTMHILTQNLSPFAFLQHLQSEQMFGNPIISFHLQNLMYRHFFMTYQNLVMFNNYEFWNYRALRQYLHFLIRFAHQFDQNDNEVYMGIIVPLIATINKASKKNHILEELSSQIIEQAFKSDIQTQSKIFNNLNQSITRLLDPQSKDELMQKLLQTVQLKSAENYREKQMYDKEFTEVVKNMNTEKGNTYLKTRAKDLITNMDSSADTAFVKTAVGREVNAIYGQLQVDSQNENIISEINKRNKAWLFLFKLLELSKQSELPRRKTGEPNMSSKSIRNIIDTLYDEGIPQEHMTQYVLNELTFLQKNSSIDICDQIKTQDSMVYMASRNWKENLKFALEKEMFLHKYQSKS